MKLFQRSILFVRTLTAGCLFVLASVTFSVQVAASGSPGDVWAVYFGSSDCTVCDHVRPLLDSLTRDEGLKIKAFDITRPEDYLVFERIESVHSANKFSVPLIIIGENILIGEKQIQKSLRKLVQRYREGNGVPLPYLGDLTSTGDGASSAQEDCKTCKDKGRPPSVQSELRKLKVFIDRLME